MFTMARNIFDFQFSLLPLSEQKEINDRCFDVFKKLQKPMTCHEARPCLNQLLKGVKNALEELHTANVAHLDIRLPNICFDRGKPILIDLDRCEKASEGSCLHLYLNSCV